MNMMWGFDVKCIVLSGLLVIFFVELGFFLGIESGMGR